MTSLITPMSYEFLKTDDGKSPLQVFLSAAVRRTMANKMYVDLGKDSGVDDNPNNLPVVSDGNLAAFVMYGTGNGNEKMLHLQVALNDNIVRYSVKATVTEQELEVGHYADYNDVM